MANDDWQTPPELIQRIEDWIGMQIMLDVCATPDNRVCDAFYSESTNALSEDIPWIPPAGAAAWMNPPYSNPLPWCAKAEAQSLTRGATIIGLLPDDRSTRWYRNHIEGKAAIELIPSRRIAFIDPTTGNPKGGNNKGSIIPIWFPWRTGTTQSIRIEI